VKPGQFVIGGRPSRRALRPADGAERIIAMSRHPPRQKLAREFGATDIVTERADEGAHEQEAIP
jgi:threonine dehydrogenase-like Zn-dependent dehydrogenase